MIDLSRVSGLITNMPASNIDIQNIESSSGIQLPDVYKELLKYTNGFSIGGGVIIYGTDDILERNETWEVDQYAPGYVAVGDDGGGNVFIMLQGKEEKTVFLVDSGDMNPHHAIELNSDFINWLSGGCLIESAYKQTEELPYICNIVLIQAPDGGLKDLVKIKSVIGLDISTGELLKASKNPPAVLAEKFPYGKAKKLIEKLGPIGTVLNVKPINT